MQNRVSMAEASRNFSLLAKMVDENGLAVILQNDKPKYVLLDYNSLQENRPADEQELQRVAERLLQRHKKAFEELAK